MNKKCLISIVLFSISCQSQDTNLYVFNPLILDDKKISLSEIADYITYIPLDNDYPIGLIYTHKILNNAIFLSVKDIGILLFDRDGQFQNIIGTRGRGPGEYRYFMSFSTNEKGKSIYVMDYNIIKVFSREGEFLRAIPLQGSGGFFQRIDNYNSKLFVSEFILAGKAKYNWLVLDTLGNLISHKRNTIPAFKSVLIVQGGTFLYKDKISYWNCYNDTIFSISPDLHYKASFLIGTEDFRLPMSELKSGKETSDYMLLSSILETNRWYILRYFYKKKAIVLVDKKSKASYVTIFDNDIKNGGIKNNLDGGLDFQPDYYFTENGREYLSSIINPYDLKVHISSNNFLKNNVKYPEKKKELEKLAASLKETDNPVLVLVRLKE